MINPPSYENYQNYEKYYIKHSLIEAQDRNIN